MLTVHDAESEKLVALGAVAGIPVSVAPALVESDLVITVTAAESVLHGGPSALARACSREVLRASGRPRCSRLDLAGLAARDRARAGCSPGDARSSASRSCSTCRGCSAATPTSRMHSSGSPARGSVRRSHFCRPPCGAHDRAGTARAERGGRLRREPVDSPHRGPPAGDRLQGGEPRRAARRNRDRHSGDDTLRSPRDPNPVAAAYLGLGLALRLWRGALRSRREARRSCSTICSGVSRHRPRRPTVPSLPGSGAPATPTRSATPSRRRSPIRAESPPTAPASRCTHSSRSSPGVPATPRSAGSARCSSQAAGTHPRPGSSASCRCTGSARPSRWRGQAARDGSASCSPRPTSPCWVPECTRCLRASVAAARKPGPEGSGLAEVRLAHLLVSLEPIGCVGRARSGPFPSRSRVGPRRAPSARSAQRAGSRCPAR